MRAADGTRIETTERIATKTLEVIKDAVGDDKVAVSLGYVGLIPASYPINTLFLWTSGPEEAVLRVALKPKSGVDTEALKERLREELPRHLRGWLREQLVAEGVADDAAGSQAQRLKFSFEPSDIINEVMSFGSPTPVEITVTGAKLEEDHAHALKIQEQLAQVASLRDLQIAQPLAYPTVSVRVDRPRRPERFDRRRRQQLGSCGHVFQPIRGA